MGVLHRKVLGPMFRVAYSIFCIARHEQIGIVPRSFTTDSSEFVRHSHGAIELLKKTAPRQLRMVQKYVAYIIDAPLHDRLAEYVAWLCVCRVDYQLLASFPRSLIVPWYASVLIHEATHGRVGNLRKRYPHLTSDQRERICYAAQRRFAQIVSCTDLHKLIQECEVYQLGQVNSKDKGPVKRVRP